MSTEVVLVPSMFVDNQAVSYQKTLGMIMDLSVQSTTIPRELSVELATYLIQALCTRSKMSHWSSYIQELCPVERHGLATFLNTKERLWEQHEHLR